MKPGPNVLIWAATPQERRFFSKSDARRETPRCSTTDDIRRGSRACTFFPRRSRGVSRRPLHAYNFEPLYALQGPALFDLPNAQSGSADDVLSRKLSVFAIRSLKSNSPRAFYVIVL